MRRILAIVGPQESLDNVVPVVKMFSENLELRLLPYKKFDDVKQIVSDNKHEINAWLFTGVIPYKVAIKYIDASNCFYLYLNGSSVMKALFEISFYGNNEVEKVSFDTISLNEMISTFERLNLSTEPFLPYPENVDELTQKVVDFHVKAYKNNEVANCLTGSNHVYQSLKDHKIPAYKIVPSKLVIENEVKKAIQKIKSDYYEFSQVSILILKIELSNKKLQKEKMLNNAYYKLDIKIQEEVIEFSDYIQGSFIRQGIDRYIIFSTKGILDDRSEVISFLEKIRIVSNLDANIGIGFGHTVQNAEHHALVALDFSRSYGPNACMIADEKGNVVGPIESEYKLTFNRKDKNIDENGNKKSKKMMVFDKILSIQKVTNKDTINSKELASWTNMTERNARRLLRELKNEGFLQEAGTEALHAKGRPITLYKVAENQ